MAYLRPVKNNNIISFTGKQTLRYIMTIRSCVRSFLLFIVRFIIRIYTICGELFTKKYSFIIYTQHRILRKIS